MFRETGNGPCPRYPVNEMTPGKIFKNCFQIRSKRGSTGTLELDGWSLQTSLAALLLMIFIARVATGGDEVKFYCQSSSSCSCYQTYCQSHTERSAILSQ